MRRFLILLLATVLLPVIATAQTIDKIKSSGTIVIGFRTDAAPLSYLADICIAVGNEAHAQTIYELLAPYAELTITAGVTTVCNGAAGRKLGGLAALLGDWNRAETHFETALKLDQAMRARPWIAHSKADYATALRRRGRREDAEHALVLEAEALEICQELGMISLGARLMDHVN